MRKLLYAALALLLSSGPSHAAGGGGTVTISRITIIGGDIFVFASGIGNPDGCASTAHFTVPSSNAGRDQMLSVLITAKVNRSPITLWFDGCGYSPWSTNAPLVGALTME
jgi:hypothetical protein